MTTPTTTTAGGREQRAALLALITTATASLAQSWAALVVAQNALVRRLQTITPGTPGAAQATRGALAAFNAAIAAFDRDTRALAERWAAQDLPTAYRDGALHALTRARADLRLFTWSTAHQAAITAITATYWADLIRRITDAVRRAQAFAREATDAARQQAGINAVVLLADHPLGTVIYGNDARHPAASWARSALAAQAAAAAARGAINTGRFDLDAQWVEVSDGPGCGWTAHTDPDTADGTIRSIDEADAYPISHPGCIREITPRPDLNNQPDIEDGAPA